MNNNPLAIVIKNAFIKNVINQPCNDDNSAYKNTIGNILKHKRIYRFEKAINQFLENSGQTKIPPFNLKTDEKNLLTFSLQLSGYIRDAQKALNKMNSSHACDPDLIKLYDAAAQYSASCNNQIEGSKYIFKEHCDYKFWKVNNTDTLAKASFDDKNIKINPNKKNLFLFMPFHIKSEQEDLRYWSNLFLNDTIDNKEIFGSKVDVYLVHFPVEQPRGEKFSLTLKTIKNPEKYYDKSDMNLAKNHFSVFFGKDIKINPQHQIIGGKKFSANEFKEACKNITILGYCSAGAHAHRFVNALSHLAKSIYPEQTVSESLKNICVINYAFLPIQENNKYSSIHFMSNYADDNMRKEPFIKMFTPEAYEKNKYKNGNNQSHITTSPNRIIEAFDLPEDFAILDSDNKKHPLANIENGHHMAVITKENANSPSNYPKNKFNSIVQRVSQGERPFSLIKTTRQRG